MVAGPAKRPEFSRIRLAATIKARLRSGAVPGPPHLDSGRAERIVHARCRQTGAETGKWPSAVPQPLSHPGGILLCPHEHDQTAKFRAHCCPGPCHGDLLDNVTRRGFLGGMAAGGAALAWVSWSEVAAADEPLPPPPRPPAAGRQADPDLRYPQRAPQTSWRSWGGIQTQQDAEAEVAQHQGGTGQAAGRGRLPRPVPARLPRSATASNSTRSPTWPRPTRCWSTRRAGRPSVSTTFRGQGQGRDLLLAAQVGPGVAVVRDHQPALPPPAHRRAAVKGIDEQDVVVDSQDEVLWRLRALCGLKNTMGSEDPGGRRRRAAGPRPRRPAARPKSGSSSTSRTSPTRSWAS